MYKEIICLEDVPNDEMVGKIKVAAKHRDSLDLYMINIRKHKLLSAQEEKDYSRLAKAGDKKARDKLINSNLRMVINIAKWYQNRGLTMQDLIEEGNIGLMRAVDRFDPEKGFRFSTYATWWIRQCIDRAIMNHSRMIRLPVHINKDVYLLSKNRDIANESNYGKKNRHLASVLGASLKKELPISELLKKVDTLLRETEPTVSLDVQMGVEGEETKSLLDYVADPLMEDPQEGAIQGEIQDKITNSIKCLNKKEQVILNKRYGFHDGTIYTLSELGAELKITREGIRQTQSRALKKLSKILHRKGIKWDFFKIKD